MMQSGLCKPVVQLNVTELFYFSPTQLVMEFCGAGSVTDLVKGECTIHRVEPLLKDHLS